MIRALVQSISVMVLQLQYGPGMVCGPTGALPTAYGYAYTLYVPDRRLTYLLTGAG